MTTVDSVDFRNAMARFASGVTVVTTLSSDGKPTAYTASAFLSLSLEPPLILVTLEKKAESHPVFERAEQFAVSVLAEGQDEIAYRFARRGTDKFADFETAAGPSTGLPLIPGALVQLECRMHDRLPGGDHTILIGEVVTARTDDSRAPLLHYNRTMGRFHPSATS